MTSDDDDLRFGDVQGDSSGGGGMSNSVDASSVAPMGVAAIVIVYIALAQPLTSTISGISMNWIAAAIILVGGLSAAAES
ncbi:hypothetical protein [Natronomonas marina]|jgi:hypothetical protein|uniref:hypothetical protein n=1 Tax=Natronomonas marina TaxID=2961939 RepID=UPI0020C9CBCD|nr:hypothetical protein [Natronomonas marina]